YRVSLFDGGKLLLGELATLALWIFQVQLDFPTGALQSFGRDQSVSAVVAFAGIHCAGSGGRKELPHRARHARSSLVHQRFNRKPAVKCVLLRRSHFRRTYDRRVQSVLRWFARSPLFTRSDFVLSARRGLMFGALAGGTFFSRNVRIADACL